MSIKNYFAQLLFFSLSFFLLAGCSSLKHLTKRETIKEGQKQKTTQSQKSLKSTKNIQKKLSNLEEKLLPSLNYVPKNQVPLSQAVEKFCERIDKSFKRYRWGRSHCRSYPWLHVRNSVLGTPLIWMVYGDENAYKRKKLDMTLVMCGVHGDEITPVRFCFDILKHMEVNGKHYKDKLIVIAPLVNPDSFFKKKLTRTNARGIDINRNFPTRDWYRDAVRLWKNRYRKDKRRYPGEKAMSEPEVLFQVNLIKRYRPDKIISVHAPLTMLDYDGPGSGDGARAKVANQLLISMSKKASGYRVRDFPYFPGSLGNYAGQERQIPTYTLELPTSDPRYSDEYWKLFRSAIHHAFLKDLKGKSKRLAKKRDQ